MKEGWVTHPLSEVPLISEEEVGMVISPYRKVEWETIEELALSLNATFEMFKIDSPLRICHFLGQVMHESGCFRYNEEIWGNTPAQKTYEGRKSLGNTEKGDGYRFRGRGYIQLTGRANYQRFAKDSGIDVISKPDIVSQPPLNMMSAGWYWDKRKLNKFADKDDLRGITYRVNGGYNGYADRFKYVNHCKKILQA